MRKLFIALVCTVIGFSAYANGTNPKEAAPAVTKTEVRTIPNENNGKPLENETEKGTLRRRQMAFTFYDGCGTQMTVWVSGGSSSTDGDLYGTAYAYAAGTLTGSGCFPR